MSQRQVFRPSITVLIDLLLIVGAGFFMLSAGNLLAARTALIAGAITAGAVLVIWFFVLGPVCKIEIVKGAMCGPTPQLGRQTLLLRRIDLRRSVEYIPHARFWGYRDIWAHDGAKIRLFRYLLGGKQMYEIMHLIKNHPFREDASATTT